MAVDVFAELAVDELELELELELVLVLDEDFLPLPPSVLPARESLR